MKQVMGSQVNEKVDYFVFFIEDVEGWLLAGRVKAWLMREALRYSKQKKWYFVWDIVRLYGTWWCVVSQG